MNDIPPSAPGSDTSAALGSSVDKCARAVLAAFANVAQAGRARIPWLPPGLRAGLLLVIEQVEAA